MANAPDRGNSKHELGYFCIRDKGTLLWAVQPTKVFILPSPKHTCHTFILPAIEMRGWSDTRGGTVTFSKEHPFMLCFSKLPPQVHIEALTILSRVMELGNYNWVIIIILTNSDIQTKPWQRDSPFPGFLLILQTRGASTGDQESNPAPCTPFKNKVALFLFSHLLLT